MELGEILICWRRQVTQGKDKWRNRIWQGIDQIMMQDGQAVCELKGSSATEIIRRVHKRDLTLGRNG